MTVIKDRHKRLIAEKDSICRIANIPAHLLYESAKTVCSPAELDWLVHFNQKRQANTNLAIVGAVNNPESKMMIMCAALLRNFVDARFIPINQIADGNAPDCTALFCPNLYIKTATKGLTLPMHRIQVVYDTLLRRLTSNKMTVVYVESMHDLRAQYGMLFHNHIEAHYQIVEYKAGV